MNPMTLQLADLYAPIEADLGRVVSIMDAELQSELPFVCELCERVRGYRGKMIRPALVLLTGQSAGGIREEHHTLAAVVELVHLATLVHDDVLDEADMRRRQATISAAEGNEAAVMLGDYLISHAFHLCSSLDSQRA
ncbi:MAG: polyprenyl synthetase family protein, partial [Planctomycetes bacterium]|nr:polyprenyl synthetase family protein [Planctomycetota bacterium]